MVVPIKNDEIFFEAGQRTVRGFTSVFRLNVAGIWARERESMRENAREREKCR